MTRVIKLNQADFSGRGLIAADIQASEWTIGNLDFLSSWIDASRPGIVPTPQAVDKRNGDVWTTIGAGPPITPSRAALNNLPAWDMTAGGSIGLVATSRVPTLSWFAAFGIEIDATLPATSTYNIAVTFGAAFGAIIRFNARKIQVVPDFANHAGSSVTHADTLANGPHAVVASWDNVTKQAYVWVDTIGNVAVATLTAAASVADNTARWRLGGTNAAQIYLADLITGEAAVGQYPYIVNALLTNLRTKYNF
jgi:hypothetical protein